MDAKTEMPARKKSKVDLPYMLGYYINVLLIIDVGLIAFGFMYGPLWIAFPGIGHLMLAPFQLGFVDLVRSARMLRKGEPG